MNIRTQIFVVVAVIIVLIVICNIVRRHKLELRYALLWLIVGVLVLLFALFPLILNAFTTLLGIELPVNMLFFLGVCFLSLIVFGQTLAISQLSDKLKRLTQEFALLEGSLRNKTTDEKENDEDEEL